MGQCEDRLSKKFQAGPYDAYYKPIRVKINAYRYTRKGILQGRCIQHLKVVTFGEWDKKLFAI